MTQKRRKKSYKHERSGKNKTKKKRKENNP
jgi:hypothetical protein